MTALDLLLGRPIASDEVRGEQIGSSVGVPVFGFDTLSYAAHGPYPTWFNTTGITISHNKRAAVTKSLLLLQGS